ncbi:DUF488 family protein [Streptomyces sp. NPDC048161]|uniref:DUF488 domain-containing protein n=1 Tax=unclassified Streptomyces TaxID=2593676 RepID=UPI00081B4773|nr:DUF488 family protein [Streptomyces sp. DvalAA-43]MYQ84148.1 DUF488 family protein [Streptomyces sp. SID4936]SCD80417.1 Uncharacterized conserved protein YeaO, DUF488 family [Streptomyces sp. DvalAA-43]
MGSSEVRVRRVYEPKEDGDGTRVLVDRLWPRGESKEKAAIDRWLKDITPSNELRDWYHQDRTATRYDAFVERYRAELADPAHTAAVGELVELVRAGGPVTLVTAVKDVPHSHVPVIVDQLEHELRHH